MALSAKWLSADWITTTSPWYSNPTTFEPVNMYDRNRIKELEAKLEEKENKRANDLQSIIAYFYQR